VGVGPGEDEVSEAWRERTFRDWAFKRKCGDRKVGQKRGEGAKKSRAAWDSLLEEAVGEGREKKTHDFKHS
jgi:hypothetical protein